MYKANDKTGQLKLALSVQLQKGMPAIEKTDYNLIVIDPPWQYNLRETDVTHRGRCPYPSMSDKAILDLPIGAIADTNAYCLLWVTNNHLPLGFRCLEAWGFAYKAIHTWVKTTKLSIDESPQVNIGIGHYGRNCTEHFLVGTKGNPGTFTSYGLTAIPNVIFAPKTKHSEKPDKFWQFANLLASKINGENIELFARSKQHNWDAWGLEIDNI